MAIGGFGGALLAGLQGLSEARQQAIQNQQAQLRMQLLQQEMEQEQLRRRAQADWFRTAMQMGGAGGLNQLPGSAPPQQPPSPYTPSPPAPIQMPGGFGGGDQGAAARANDPSASEPATSALLPPGAISPNGMLLGGAGFGAADQGTRRPWEPAAGGSWSPRPPPMDPMGLSFGFAGSSTGGGPGTDLGAGDDDTSGIRMGPDGHLYGGTIRPGHDLGTPDEVQQRNQQLTDFMRRQASPLPMGGGMMVPVSAGAGGDTESAKQQYIDMLVGQGVPRAAAAGATEYMRRNESGLSPQARNPISGATGGAQWLGPRKQAIEAQYGTDRTVPQEVAFTRQELQGPEARTLQALRGATTEKQGYDIWGKQFERPGAAALAKAGVTADRETTQAANAATTRTAQLIDPVAYGRASLSELAKLIDRANPGESDEVKGMVLDSMFKVLAPYEKLQYQQLLRDELGKDLKLFEDKSGQQHWLTPGQPIPPDWHEAGPRSRGAGALRGSRNIEVTDKGKTIFSGSAHQDPQTDEWISDKDGKKIEVPESANIRIAGVGEGGRISEAQTGRLLGATTQVAAAISNLAKMPKGSTLGIFGGLQQQSGDSLTEAVKRNLANRITPETSQMMYVITRGISRSLATLEAQGAATGLVGLATQMEGDLPRDGDSGLTALGKLADIRQITEAAIETLMASPRLSDSQKELITRNLDKVKQAIPFTVGDVIGLQNPEGDETYADFAKSIGLGGGGEGGAPPKSGVPKVDDQGNVIPPS